jgi:phosphoenolpyruvate carboxylase
VIDETANLNIGSRPSARIEDLPAIPWVFSWAQMPIDAASLVWFRQCGQMPGARSAPTGIFARLRAEWQGVVSALLTIMGQNSLLENNPLLARSMRNRFPYLDPPNHMAIHSIAMLTSRPPGAPYCRNSRCTTHCC